MDGASAVHSAGKESGYPSYFPSRERETGAGAGAGAGS